MNKLTTLALAGALAVSSLASASVTRWTGFGVSSLFIADVQDTFTLPQTVASNPDAMYLEFGSLGNNMVDDQAWGGAHLKLGPGVLGVWGNRPYAGWPKSSVFSKGLPNIWATGSNAGTAFLVPGNTVNIFYALEMSDKMTLGVGLNRSGDYSGTKTESLSGVVTNSDQSAIDYGLSLGVDIKELGPISALQVGLQYNFGGAENKRNDGTAINSNTEAWSVINLRVGADINGDNGKFQRVEIGYGLSLAEAKTKPAVAPLTTDFDKATASSSLWT